MTGLASEIARAKAGAFERNEAALAESVSVAAIAIDDATRRAVQPFVEWCNSRQVRYCAAKPATVAAFVFDRARSMPCDRLLDVLQGIERVHDAYQLANPVACHAVSVALAMSIEIDPPRSWPKEDKRRFLQLPVPIQAIVERRERDRDKWLRQKQEAAANEKKEAA